MNAPNTIYVAVCFGQPQAFLNKDHRDALVAQWNEDNQGNAELVMAKAEDWPEEKWRWHGPGGMQAVWGRMPERHFIHFQDLEMDATGKTVSALGPVSRWAWEFETDVFTTSPASAFIDHRPGSQALTMVRALGLDLMEMVAAFAVAHTRALEVCVRHPHARENRRL